MDQQLSDLLGELREAINEALEKSERVAAAITALEQTGRDVQVAIDAAVVDDAAEAESLTPEDEKDFKEFLRLNAADKQFLHTLRIRVETGLTER